MAQYSLGSSELSKRMLKSSLSSVSCRVLQAAPSLSPAWRHGGELEVARVKHGLALSREGSTRGCLLEDCGLHSLELERL